MDERSPDVRRGALYPIELLARMQLLFVSVTPPVENPPNVRRGALYPIELLARRAFALSVILRLPVLFRQVVLPC